MPDEYGQNSRYSSRPEVTGLDEVAGPLILRRAAALRSDLDDLPGLGDRRLDRARVGHRIGHRLLDVRVAPRPQGFDAVQRMLEVGGRDDHRIDVLAVVQLVVVAAQLRPLAHRLFEERRAFFAPDAPDVRHRDDLEVQRSGVLLEGGDQRITRAVGEADDADADPIVRADDARLRRRRTGKREARGPGARDLDELSPRGTNRHVPTSFLNVRRGPTPGSRALAGQRRRLPSSGSRGPQALTCRSAES
jgi:hypothetical protein